MSESKSEIVSSLVDNFRNTDEIFDEHSLDELISQNELSETWDRYHLIGDVMRNEIPQTLELDLSANIASAIAAEPTILAPAKDSNNSHTTKESADKAASKGIKAKVIQLIKPFGQIAIAASAAGIMLLGVQQNSSTTDAIVPSQVVQTVPLSGYASPVSYNLQQPASRQSQKQAYIEQQRRFQALLSDHQQQLKLMVAHDKVQPLSSEVKTKAVQTESNQ